jgi:hypothetical protein
MSSLFFCFEFLFSILDLYNSAALFITKIAVIKISEILKDLYKPIDKQYSVIYNDIRLNKQARQAQRKENEHGNGKSVSEDQRTNRDG